MSKAPMPFPNPTTYAGHGGVDFGQPSGTPIRAIVPGVITYSANWGRGGLTKTITRSDGLKVMYCHLVSLAGKKVGDKVKVGDIVGYVGSTGNSTGPHLHLEMWLNGVAQDEWDWMDRNNWIGKTAPAGGDSTPVSSETIGKHAMMIHWNEPDAIIKPGKSGQYHATEGPRNHFLVFDGPILVDEFYADSLSGTQAKANAYAKQCGGASVLVSRAEYNKTRARLVAASQVALDLDSAALKDALSDALAGSLGELIADGVAAGVRRVVTGA